MPVGPRHFNNRTREFSQPQYLARTSASVDRYDGRTVMLPHLVPIVRASAAPAAGASAIHYRTSVVYNAIVALLWAVGVTVAGFLLSRITLRQVQRRADPRPARPHDLRGPDQRRDRSPASRAVHPVSREREVPHVPPCVGTVAQRAERPTPAASSFYRGFTNVTVAAFLSVFTVGGSANREDGTRGQRRI